jgi:hypothetical protein
LSVQTIKGNTEVIDLGSAVVDYSQSLEEMISHCIWAQRSPHVNSTNFPVTHGRQGAVQVALFSIARKIPYARILPCIRDANCVPANLPEMLAIIASQLYLQRGFPILVIDQYWNERGGIFVPCLRLPDERRHLGLYQLESSVPANFSFAVIRIPRERQLFE